MPAHTHKISNYAATATAANIKLLKMDAQAKKKALFRAKLNAQKQEKQRIDSPLARYNEHDQLICRICDVVIKSESLWPAHQASRKHHEAIDKLKANAAALNRPNNAKTESAKELPKPKPEPSRELNDKSEPSTAMPTHQSSTLPPEFFDKHETKRQKIDSSCGGIRHRGGTDRSSNATSIQMRNPEIQDSKDFRQVSGTDTGLEAKQVKGALPEGFFDDKDSDLRARGITPVKPNVKGTWLVVNACRVIRFYAPFILFFCPFDLSKILLIVNFGRDEYKEFEKLIQEDLQEVDNRMEEEEFDAAEVIEEEETVEQRAYIERVEMLRRKKLELRASKSAVVAKDTEVKRKKSSDEDSSSDEDNDFKVDWRAKRL
ncbi:hypothetical protein DH2020_038814 [Rehmannia glutinosa]|uniref:C2H2-type domain-containing protein n=1 Tax=Rehmannia glutinosa TaxID=99300 RepID=A0ABR0UZN5_REHGL